VAVKSIVPGLVGSTPGFIIELGLEYGDVPTKLEALILKV
jgi:hypothetical protein